MSSTESILSKKYPAKAHYLRVLDYIKSKTASPVDNDVIYLEGQKSRMNEDNDQEAPFRQRRYFYYLTGCELPDCSVVYDVKSGKSTLFIPPVVEDEVIWSGLPLMKEEALKRYDIDDARSCSEVQELLNDGSNPKYTIWAIAQQISDHIDFLAFEETDVDLLKEAIEECRVVKDEYEVALIRRANEISRLAHIAVMRSVKHAKNERELEAIFLERCIANGCRNQAYSSIIATGTDAATLHYIKNNKPITSSHLNLLLDAGGELDCYAADITRTFPINGHFSPASASIYSLVLKMQKDCMTMLKAGVLWDDVHATAHKIAITGLLDLGILKGDAKHIFDAKTSVAFFPHGLGHYLGMDTHDTGGHADYKDPDPMYRYLRVRGRLPAGSVITVEPGVYFCRYIIEPYLKKPEQAKYIDETVLDRYWDVGGVRIEDNVLITETGFENLTTVPKEIEQMEKLING